jgi:hypothetical protein
MKDKLINSKSKKINIASTGIKSKIAVYTSCSANYLAKAIALSNSIISNNFTVDFHLLYCDEAKEAIERAKKLGTFYKVHTLESMNLNEEEIFKYSVMELCTKVKGQALVELLNTNSYDYVIYLDPDSILFEQIDEIIREFNDCDIGLIPHFQKPLEINTEAFRLTELSVLRHGLYNLGFLYIRNSKNSKDLAVWWADRLMYNCYDDPLRGRFTDQRMFDEVPIIFDGVKISKSKVINVASWNISERDLSFVEDASKKIKFYVDDNSLLMYHFSGVNSKGVSDMVVAKLSPSNPAIRMLECWYKDLLNKYDQEYYEEIPFFGDKFKNGNRVDSNIRRLYAENIDLQIAFPFPLKDSSYEDWLISERKYYSNKFPSPSLNVCKRDFIIMFDIGLYSNIAKINYQNDNEGIKKVLRHYVEHSTNAKFNPNRFFDTAYILFSQNFPLSVKRLQEGMEFSTPLFQFLLMGSQSTFKPNLFYDEDWYLRNYPEALSLVRSGRISNGFVHYCTVGCRKNFDPGPNFSESRYLSLHPDVKEAIDKKILICGFDHFMQAGLREARPF